MFYKIAKYVKSFLFWLVFFIINFSCFAADGLLWGDVRIRVLNTEWFQIIYPEASEGSAALLAENADRIYEEISHLYGREPAVKLPVVLCPSTEEYNAYFSSDPYNRIVLYDTAIGSDMTVFSEDLLSTFRHELTHAFTYNLKNPFWSFIGSVFGDCISPASFMISPGWAEGATMTSEASSGEGRLNSEYAMHMVKQAKIENQFPVYADVQGASDKYPGGSYYYFNGAFDQWLQKKYGMEKYAEFWYRIVNWKSLTPSLAFRKIYGCSVAKAWSDFKDVVAVPAIPENPLMNSSVTDFFSGDSADWSSENLSGAIYSSLCKSVDGFAYIERKSGSIFYGGKKIGTLSGAEKISFSKDGRFMAVSYTDGSTPTYTRKIKIYDTRNHKWTKVSGTGISDGTLVQSGNEYYLVNLGFKSQKKWIEIRKLEFSDGNKVKDAELVRKIEMGKNEMPLSFTALESSEGSFAYVRKLGLTFSLCIMNIMEPEVTEYFLPYEKMTLRDLSFSDESKALCFSWTVPGSMPLFGKLDLRKETFVLYKDEFSGGVFSPVEMAEGEIIFEGHFYRQNRLLSLKESLLSEKTETAAEKSVYINAVTEENRKDNLQVLENSRPYSALSFLDGVFVPASVLISENRDICDSRVGELTSCFLGFTYVGSNPWSSNIIQLSGGYDPFSGTGGVSLAVDGGTDTGLFKWNVKGQVDVDAEGFRQGTVDFGTSLNIALGQGIRLGISDQLLAGTVRIHSLGKNMEFLGNSAELFLTNVHKSGPGYFEYAGLTLGTKIRNNLTFLSEVSANGPRFSPFMNIYVPKLIPVSCRDFYTYNLPFTLKTEFFPDKNSFAGGTADLCLFAMDIQKSVPFARILYFNRIYLNSGYSGLYADKTGKGNIENAEFFDCLFFRATAGLSPSYYSNLYSEFNCQFSYYLRNPNKNSTNWRFSFGFSINGI